ncbi:MAG: TonB-dependent receptor [Pseudomonadota bacterium]
MTRQTQYGRHFSGRKAFRYLALSSSALMLMAATAAHAEDRAPAADPDTQTQQAQDQQNSSGQLEEIIVTARRTSENVQTTPVSVTAVSTKEIADLDITRLDAIQQLTPNLTVVTNGPSAVAPMLYLRGIGSPSVALYSEPPVALYVDGLYMPRPTGAAFDLPDLAGAEVLRGPQGTLFGRNTTGGAILLTTERPRDAAGAKVRLSYGSNNDIQGAAVLHSGTLGGGLRAKLVLQSHDRDGWVKFPGFDKDEWGGSLHSRSAALTVAGETGDFTLENAASYNYVRSAVGWQTLAANATAVAYFNMSPSYGGPAFLMSDKPLDLAYRSPLLTTNEATIKAFSDRFTLTYDGGAGFQFKSITGYSSLEENLTGQLGGSYVLGPVNRLGATVIEPVITHVTPNEPGEQDQFSQEFNFTGTLGDFSYVAGLYYFRESVDETINTVQMSRPTSATSPVTITDRSVTYSGSTKSYAAYGQLSYHPRALDGLEISGGIRFTHDDKTVKSFTAATSSATGVTTYTGTVASTGLPGSGTSGIAPSTGKDSWENTGWAASVSYRVTPTIYIFGRATSAFRAGGFNAGSTNAPSYAPETAVSYEGGIKSEWFDRHVRLNIVGYHTDYDGLQINQYFGPPRNTNFISNAGKATYDGIEAEFNARFGGFSLDADFGRIWPKYQEYLIGALPLPAICGTNPNDPSCTQNVADIARFSFLSDTSIHVGAQYESPETPIGVITARVDYSYKSTFRFSTLDLLSPNNTAVNAGDQRNLSARIIVSKIPVGTGNFSLQVYGDNLTDERYVVEAIDLSTTMNGIYNRPRSFGVILTADF